MTNPGPRGDADDPLARPDIGMGLPESGTQHATSTDFTLPVDGPAGGPASDPLTGDLPDAGSTAAAPPAAQPAAPLFDEVAATSEDFQAISDNGSAVYGDDPMGGGALDKVKAFAAQKPQLFLAAALAVGIVLGRLFRSSDDSDDSAGE